MSESSTEKPESAVDETKGPDEQKKVPVEVVAKARSATRAAKAEADSLREELAKKSDAVFSAEDISRMIDEITTQAMSAVNDRIGPIERERDKYQAMASLRMSPEQADKVLEIRSKHAGLSLEQAAAVAKADHPDMFSSTSPAPFNPMVHGAFPVGGNSPMRHEPQREDFVKKMKDAAASGDRVAAQHYAREEFLRRAREVFLSNRGGPR